jgi:hypothetical protein
MVPFPEVFAALLSGDRLQARTDLQRSSWSTDAQTREPVQLEWRQAKCRIHGQRIPL